MRVPSSLHSLTALASPLNISSAISQTTLSPQVDFPFLLVPDFFVAQNEYYLEDIFDEDSKHEKLAETVPPGQYFLRHDPKR